MSYVTYVSYIRGGKELVTFVHQNTNLKSRKGGWNKMEHQKGGTKKSPESKPNKSAPKKSQKKMEDKETVEQKRWIKNA